MSGSWSNVGSFVTLIIETGTAGSGIFVYDPAPGTGNLVASIAAADGTDPYGNQYAAGFVSYDQSASTFAQLLAGEILFGPLTSGSGTLPSTIRAGALTTDTVASGVLTAGETLIKSRTTNDRAVANFLKLISGSPGFGGVGNPHVIIGGPDPEFADGYVTGSMIKSSDGLTPDKWQIPGVGGVAAFNANWSGSTTFNGTANWGTFQYRKTAEDEVWMLGCFKAAAGAGAAVLKFPADFTPQAQWPIWIQRNNAGTLSSFNAEVGPSGNFNILAGSGGGMAAGNEYLVNAKFPLGNLPTVS